MIRKPVLGAAPGTPHASSIGRLSIAIVFIAATSPVRSSADSSTNPCTPSVMISQAPFCRVLMTAIPSPAPPAPPGCTGHAGSAIRNSPKPVKRVRIRSSPRKNHPFRHAQRHRPPLIRLDRFFPHHNQLPTRSRQRINRLPKPLAGKILSDNQPRQFIRANPKSPRKSARARKFLSGSNRPKSTELKRDGSLCLSKFG